MTSAAQAAKGVLPKLVPFFKTLAIYFVVFIPQDQPSVLATILKCLPIIGLVIFIVLQSKSTSTENKFSKCILLGLLFSCLGDALLIWPGCFDFGVFSFLIGHLMYINAFRFEPLNLKLGAGCYIISLLGIVFFWSKLHGILTFGAPIYSAVIMTMVWRAIARVKFTERKWSWSKGAACLGAIIFAISDFFVGYNRFYGMFPYDQLIIMTTYYTAQFGLALSILDATVDVPKQEVSLDSPQQPVMVDSHQKQH
ncbi:hypothetical protein FQA39_LY02169 [Lamprigera yunnana]|nr:hypothetical protein FQA39_LY02169 [Lamprigera yunnana]